MTTTDPSAPQLTLTTAPGRPWQRGFWSLFLTQFQGAFNDNAFKFLVTFLVLSLGFTTDERDQLAPVVGALFALPFILFSMSGGYLSDRYSKRSVAIGTKVAELTIMATAVVGLALNSIPLLIAVVFLLSTQSAFFGPAKYGLLPELLPRERLSWGNGTISLGTFVAIIAGTIVAGQLSELFRGRQVWSGVILFGFSLLGLAASWGISRVPPASVTKEFRLNFVPEFLKQFRMIRTDRVLFLAVLGASYFWFLSALLQLSILFFGKDVLQLGDAEISYFMGTLAIGIGAGSFTSGHLSGRQVEYGLVPLGALGLTVFTAVLAHPGLTTFGPVAIVLLCLGFFGGFSIVPLNAIIQQRPDPQTKGSVIATAAVLSFTGVFLASCAYYVFTLADFSLRQIFLVSSAMTLVGATYATYLLPDSLLRLLFWLLTHTLYRVRVEGRDNVPERGGALCVCNHLSFVDIFLILASTDRHIRFIMWKGLYDRLWIKPFARILRVIPLASDGRPREMIQSLRAASEAIKNGEVVCIFAEGQITRIGQLLPFRQDFVRIMKDVDAPIIPVCLDGVWGSIFSFEKQRRGWKLPHRIPYPVTVSYGRPLPARSTPLEVRQGVQELITQAWTHRKARMRPLHRSFVRTARHHPFRLAMADARAKAVRFGSALTRTIFLARRLRCRWQGQHMVGILLPPSVPGALVNFAALLAGRVPVNLNYTLPAATLASCVQQCQIETVVTSEAFLSRLKLTVPCRTLLMEEVAATPGIGEQVIALLMTWLLPVRVLEQALGRTARAELDDLATVIFSSGSTGEPKGVMLTHYNIASNVEQLGQTFALDRSDRMLGILPFFHSFGFTGTLCLPAMLGVGVAYHPSPLDARGIGDLVREYAITFLLATPTFLQIYLRGCAPEQFGSVEFVMVGAERLPDRVADAFEERFGIRPFEAYGCTECAPAVTVNRQDFRGAGFRQVGGKRGKIGHPLPGLSVRIVDPDTFAPRPVGESGLLLVSGPNVMQGYLGLPEKTAEVLQDGWYVTGDIAVLDEDGFLAIIDRLSRFSKIGGEMVPHMKIEEQIHAAAGVTDHSFAVTAVPDEKKGERLIVLHILDEAPLKACLDTFAQSDLPNLWKPRADQFCRVAEFPYLGTGKLDLRAVRELALQFATS